MKTVVTAVSALLLAGAAQAEDWQWQPRIELGYLYDDNYRLELPINEIEVSGGVLDLQLMLLSASPLTEWSLTPQIRSTYFPDDPSEESTDYTIGYDFRHRGQKTTATVRAQYSDESVVRSEQPTEAPIGGEVTEPGLGEGIDPDSGRLTVRNRRQMLDFSPSIVYAATQRRSFEAGGHYLDVDFDESAIEQIAYIDYGLFGGVTFAQSPRTNMTLRALVSQYDPESRSNEATAYGAQIEWASAATQNTQTYLRLGAQHTELDRPAFVGTAQSKTNYIAGIGGRWTGQVNRVLADATHNVGPTSSGFIVIRDQLRFRWTRRMTERADFITGIRGIRDSGVDDASPYETRTYANGSIGFQWRMLRQLTMNATYDYTWQEFADEPSDRKSQGFFFSFIFEPLRHD